ncbi:hypothetical protein like AT5G64160 [Hibiscus trionum]|uniref:Uncharacterized protein n=1 Tax=Hibiscus trionum TaxID=183268 RepID=A0A9W7MRM9_HIBTR|nr:hypothetical protein like AT5G64160 [Hibiscus trionum]
MSLSLLQGYSSAEDEEPAEPDRHHYGDSSDEDGGEDGDAIGGKTHSAAPKQYDSSVFDFPDPSRKSALPSAFDAFSQVSGPPEFLNHAVEEPGSVSDSAQQQGRRGGRRDFKDKKDMPSGAVVEAKPQLVGIHERVRSDIEGSKPPTSAVPSTKQDGAKRVPSATNPNAEDAAELLRMCLQCGVPKTYTSARGMVCPVCGDRPLADADKDSKKKGSTIKDKEKSKRMRGQSSHATWKSETEMQLRQQFD